MSVRLTIEASQLHALEQDLEAWLDDKVGAELGVDFRARPRMVQLAPGRVEIVLEPRPGSVHWKDRMVDLARRLRPFRA